MYKQLLKAGTACGALAVILGAFAAHSIKNVVTTDTLAIFETGVRYQMYHSFAIIACAIIYKEFPFKTIVWSGRMFIAGIIMFSGSLYLMTYLKTISGASLGVAGIITPIGGIALIAGWVLLFISFLKKDVQTPLSF